MSTIIEKESVEADAEGATIADQAFKRIQDEIVQGKYPPNSKINESELCREFKISRGPLREAIRRLEERRLLVRTPYAGVKVVALNKQELIDIYLTREAIESTAAGLAAECRSDEMVQRLSELLHKHRSQISESKGEDYFQEEGDMDFHYLIVMNCGNQVLKDIYSNELYHRIRMYRYQLSRIKGRPYQALDEHQRIYEALLHRDREVAEVLMRRHISLARKNLEKVDLEF